MRLTNIFPLIAGLILFVAKSSLCADCWTLKTGEKFYGELVSRDAKSCVVKTKYGQLTFSNEDLVDCKISTPNISQANVEKSSPSISTKQVSADAGALTKSPVEAHSEKSVEQKYIGSAEKTLLGALNDEDKTEQYLFNSDSFTKDYKDFMKDNFPEGWLLKLRFGYSDSVAATERKSFTGGISLNKEWEVLSFEINAYYDYARDTYNYIDWSNVNIVQKNVTSIDKYGVNAALKYKFLGAKSDWFLIYAPDYRVDVIKGIYPQIDNMVGVGYDLKYFKEYGLAFDISVGFTPKYMRVESEYSIFGVVFKDENSYFMPSLSVRQNLKWDIHKMFSIEQKLRYSPDIEGLFWNGSIDDFINYTGDGAPWMHYYSLYFSVSLIFKPVDVFNIFLRYSYDFDMLSNNKNNSLPYDSESKLTIGFEIPLGWKK